MGLGKTLTMIALVLRAQEYENERNADEENKPIVANKVKSKLPKFYAKS